MKSYHITFKWAMTEQGLATLWRPDRPEDGDDLGGKVYFGNFVLELIWDGCIQNYTGCYVLGWDNYDYWGNDPYGQCDDLCLPLPHCDNLAAFRDQVEQDIIDKLKKRPDLLKEAVVPTDMSRWTSFQDRTNYVHEVIVEVEV